NSLPNKGSWISASFAQFAPAIGRGFVSSVRLSSADRPFGLHSTWQLSHRPVEETCHGAIFHLREARRADGQESRSRTRGRPCGLWAGLPGGSETALSSRAGLR